MDGESSADNPAQRDECETDGWSIKDVTKFDDPERTKYIKFSHHQFHPQINRFRLSISLSAVSACFRRFLCAFGVSSSLSAFPLCFRRSQCAFGVPSVLSAIPLRFRRSLCAFGIGSFVRKSLRGPLIGVRKLVTQNVQIALGHG
jgi:hypothetical protein